MHRFEGKRVLVTGGARGIGAATVRAFREEGAVVAVGAKTMASYESFVAAHGADGCHPAIGPLQTKAECSAGVYVEIDIADVDDAHWETTMGVNAGGTFFCSQAALPALEASRGAIVNLGSDAGLVGQSDAVPYAASKGAVVNLTRAMAVALAERVRVNCVCPGFIWTDMVERMAEASGDYAGYVAAARAHSPMKRIGTPQEVASAILYLASPAAGFINGVALPIDGGGLAGF